MRLFLSCVVLCACAPSHHADAPRVPPAPPGPPPPDVFDDATACDGGDAAACAKPGVELALPVVDPNYAHATALQQAEAAAFEGYDKVFRGAGLHPLNAMVVQIRDGEGSAPNFALIPGRDYGIACASPASDLDTSLMARGMADGQGKFTAVVATPLLATQSLLFHGSREVADSYVFMLALGHRKETQWGVCRIYVNGPERAPDAPITLTGPSCQTSIDARARGEYELLDQGSRLQARHDDAFHDLCSDACAHGDREACVEAALLDVEADAYGKMAFLKIACEWTPTPKACAWIPAHQGFYAAMVAQQSSPSRSSGEPAPTSIDGVLALADSKGATAGWSTVRTEDHTTSGNDITFDEEPSLTKEFETVCVSGQPFGARVADVNGNSAELNSLQAGPDFYVERVGLATDTNRGRVTYTVHPQGSGAQRIACRLYAR